LEKKYKMKYKIYLDDVRTPVDKDWVVVRNGNTYHNYTINYDNITEKTGYDCAKWLVDQWLDGSPVVDIRVHSANGVGAGNICGIIWNYMHTHRLPQNNNMRWIVPFTISN